MYVFLTRFTSLPPSDPVDLDLAVAELMAFAADSIADPEAAVEIDAADASLSALRFFWPGIQ